MPAHPLPVDPTVRGTFFAHPTTASLYLTAPRPSLRTDALSASSLPTLAAVTCALHMQAQAYGIGPPIARILRLQGCNVNATCADVHPMRRTIDVAGRASPRGHARTVEATSVLSGAETRALHIHPHGTADSERRDECKEKRRKNGSMHGHLHGHTHTSLRAPSTGSTYWYTSRLGAASEPAGGKPFAFPTPVHNLSIFM
ncbi:hypothetical protein K438DRAFT_1954159 [Mycena galopus ATCC 62051]|nr:hypothetical protein K438DRAFT_1954159 [Mycena galopus ATCC 62051]